jgi:polyisoprenoid-binding protein YceI
MGSGADRQETGEAVDAPRPRQQQASAQGPDGHPHADDDHHVIVDRLPAGVWIVDPRGSQVNFRARTIFGLLPVNGMFASFEGEMRVDADGVASGTLNVESGSIETGIHRRDEHLSSPEFLDVIVHPRILFTLGSVQTRAQQDMRFSSEDQMLLTGQLKIRDTVIALELPVTVIAHGDHLHMEGKVRIDHRAHGLRWARPGLVGKTLRVEVALTLNPQP